MHVPVCQMWGQEVTFSYAKSTFVGYYRTGAPMDKVAMDIPGPLSLSQQVSKYVLTVMDCFSRWTDALCNTGFFVRRL